jgi:hypothetical protein
MRCTPDDRRMIPTYSCWQMENTMRRTALLGCLLAGVCWAVAVHAHAQATPPGTGAAPSGAATPVATGNFTGIVHKTSGKAIMFRTADGGHVLRLEDFKTSNGPDVRVYLVKGTSANNSDFIKAGGDNFVDGGTQGQRWEPKLRHLGERESG